MNNLSVQVCKGVRAFSRQRRLSSRRGLAVELKDLPAWSAASAETGRSERATHPFDPDDYALLKAIHRSPFQINVALGASSGNILGLVSYQALGMVAAGVALWIVERRSWTELRLVTPQGWRILGTIGLLRFSLHCLLAHQDASAEHGMRLSVEDALVVLAARGVGRGHGHQHTLEKRRARAAAHALRGL